MALYLYIYNFILYLHHSIGEPLRHLPPQHDNPLLHALLVDSLITLLLALPWIQNPLQHGQRGGVEVALIEGGLADLRLALEQALPISVLFEMNLSCYYRIITSARTL